MSEQEVDILKRALAREKAARKAAEKILEAKSAELYNLAQELKFSNDQLEKMISEKTSELRGVFENIVDAYVVMDLWGQVLKMNESAVTLLGYNNEVEDFNLLELADSSQAERIMDGFQILISEGSITNFQVNINTKNRGQRLVHVNASLIIDKNNEPIAAQGIVRDITEKKKAEQQLIESENRLATLIQNLDSGILLEDEHRTIALTNKKFCELFNIPLDPTELSGRDCSNSADESKDLFEDSERFVKRIEEIITNRQVVLGDELVMKNGTILERDYIPIFDNMHYKGHLWEYKDITLKQKYRASIEAEREKYSNIIANMNLGLIEVSNDDEILMANNSFLEMSGYSEDELIGCVASETFPTEESKKRIYNENLDRKKGLSNSYEIEAKNKDGQVRNWLVSGAPNYNLAGEIVGSIGIHLDITELKQLEQQKENLLKELEKSNNELQEYAHIVSHDLKSPLRSINALISWIKEDNKGKLDANSLQNFDHIESTLERMELLISDVLEYSSIGSESLNRTEIDLNEIIADIKHILVVPDHININVVNSLPVIKGEKTKMLQLFQNLIGNAIKFNDKEIGFVEIDIEEKASFYKFSIKDNGMGIDKQYHDKIFKIFNALNKRKDSTGIGLTIVKKIIDLYKGEIWIESEPGIGTTFHFTLKK
ncbi:MAG: PAS domain S-box protein [Psychroserpens sp.]|nr:PAS domain S-box protein [Psychroserpens sp.]